MIAVDANDPKGHRLDCLLSEVGQYLGADLPPPSHPHQARAAPVEDARSTTSTETSPSVAGRVDLFAQLHRQADRRGDHAGRRAGAAEGAGGDGAPTAGGVLPVKTHSFLGRVFDVPLINLGVSVGAIYIVRNPLDVAVSLAALPLRSRSTARSRRWARTLNASPTTRPARRRDLGIVERERRELDHQSAAGDQGGALRGSARRPDHRLHRRSPITCASARRRPRSRRRCAWPPSSELTKRGGGRRLRERPPWIDRFFRAGRAGQWKRAPDAGAGRADRRRPSASRCAASAIFRHEHLKART